MQRDFCLIEGSIQGTVVFCWSEFECDVIADQIILENDYGRSELRRQSCRFDKQLFDIIEAELKDCFSDDPDMIDMWRRAEQSETGYRVKWRRA